MHYTVIGGRLMGSIELSISGQLPVTMEQYIDNVKRASVNGVPEVEKYALGKRRVALVAGGPSINDHVDTLKAWDGEVWAVNGAYGWCMERGIEATLLAIDPHEIVLRWARGAHKAILGNTCAPEVFELLKGADVRQVRLGIGAILGMSSTATSVPHLAAHAGASHVTFFGCESSFVGDSHAYQDRLNELIAERLHEDRNDHIIITCGGEDYLTVPDFYRQAGELAGMIRELPWFLAEESGGLLRAMIENKGEHRVKWIAESYAEGMSPVPKTSTPAEEAA